MLFQRTFHAVGQGAFYSEEISDKPGGRLFRMVYDCGSSTLSNKDMQKKAASDLGADTEVDLLIVSHFDRDHINGIPALNPKRVMIPFLSRDICIYLMAQAYIADGEFDIDMALHPERVFPEAQIIRVLPAPRENTLSEEDRLRRREVSLLETLDINSGLTPRASVVDIDSGAVISVTPGSSDRPLWEYIPYNPNMEEFAEKFKAAIIGKQLAWDSLQYGQYFMKHFAEIKKIYNALGNKNRHSLVVYSGSRNSVRYKHFEQCLNRTWMKEKIIEYKLLYGSFLPLNLFVKASIMYFGDATISPEWLPKLYDKLGDSRLYKVSFIQIPHHGSCWSHGELIVKKRPTIYCLRGCLCIISHGSKNRYRHPSSTLISSLINEDSLVITVTENPASMLSTSFHIL